MRSIRLPLPALVIACATLVVACGRGETSSAGDAAVPGAGPPDAPAPFTAERLGGGDLTSASFAGQDTVLWFWAPWCTVCRGEADDVVAAAGAVEGKVQVVGVAGRGEVAEMEDFVSETGTGGLTHVVDDSGSIWSSYEVAAQPAYAFLDDSGSVEVVVGALGEEALVERMTALAEA